MADTIETFSRKMPKHVPHVIRKPVKKPGPHILEVFNSAVYCSCGHSEGASNGRMAMHLATTHVRENLVWLSRIDDNRR